MESRLSCGWFVNLRRSRSFSIGKGKRSESELGEEEICGARRWKKRRKNPVPSFAAM